MPMKARYTVADGEVVSEMRGGVRKDYVPDPLGSTVALLDNAPSVTDAWEYWPYGEVRSGSSATPFQFVGTVGYYKDSSRRTYVRARHYRQNHGRWQTVDPLWPSVTPFEYADSSPVLARDPSGTRPQHSPFLTSDCPSGLDLQLQQAAFSLKRRLNQLCHSRDKGTGLKNRDRFINCLLANGLTQEQVDKIVKCLCETADGIRTIKVTCRDRAYCKLYLPTCMGAIQNSNPCMIDVAHPDANCSLPAELDKALSHELAHCCGTSHRRGPDPAIIDKCLSDIIGWGWGA